MITFYYTKSYTFVQNISKKVFYLNVLFEIWIIFRSLTRLMDTLFAEKYRYVDKLFWVARLPIHM